MAAEGVHGFQVQTEPGPRPQAGRTVRALAAFLGTYWRANLAAQAEYRLSFAAQVVAMMVNNSTWLAFWALFFARFPEVRGWTFPDMVACWSVGAAGLGLSRLLFGGATLIPGLIETGGLDTYLPQPKPVLLHVLAGRMSAFALGDLLWGTAGFLALYPWRPWHLAGFAVAVPAVAALVTGVLVLTGSLAFWLGRSGTLQTQVYSGLLHFATWPPTVYGPEVRLLLYTVLPALLMGYVPARALREASAAGLLGLAAAGAAFAAAGVLVFARGLRRYESGNRLLLRD